MAAPMSFLPRVIIGATTFTVVVAGAFYLYYRSRYIFGSRKPSGSTLDEKDKDVQNLEASDEPEHRKVSLQSAADDLVVSLISLLETEEEDGQLCRVLTTLANKAAFIEGQNAVRLAGGLPVIARQLERPSERVQACTASCLANLSLNRVNQPLLKDCIPTLLELSADGGRGRSLRLACLQALVNLTVSGQCGGHFGRPALASLFGLLLLGDGGARASLAQQALRVLVNLSADKTAAPALLNLKVPEGFTNLLVTQQSDECLQRVLSFCINLKQASVAPGSPPAGGAAADGLTFARLLAGGSGDELGAAAMALLGHGQADVRQQAGRLATMLSGPSS